MKPIKQACYFSFDGINCKDFGLQLLSFGTPSGTEEQSTTSSDASEDRSLRKLFPFHYGVDQTSPLSFELTFGKTEEIIRSEVSEIFAWLIGHQQYKWLEIHRDDMEHVRYKVIITQLAPIAMNGRVLGFRASVQCDCPFAYGYPKTFSRNVSGKSSLRIVNSSSYNGYIYPPMEVRLKAGSTSFSVVNKSNDDREFCIQLPQPLGIDVTFRIDNETFIIQCDASQIANVYQCVKDYKEFRLIRGINDLEISGNGFIKFACEFLYAVGY